MNKINYIQGDLFQLYPKDKKIAIPHVCNDKGVWGSGFVIPLGLYFPEAKQRYIIFRDELELGTTQFIRPENTQVTVFNMIAQTLGGPRPIRYNALVHCMESVGLKCRNLRYEIWCPKFGSLRAGGNWSFIENLIEDIWLSNGLEVNVCYLD